MLTSVNSVITDFFKIQDFVIFVPCSTESKTKTSSFLFKTKLSLLNVVFRSNNKNPGSVLLPYF